MAAESAPAVAGRPARPRPARARPLSWAWRRPVEAAGRLGQALSRWQTHWAERLGPTLRPWWGRLKPLLATVRPLGWVALAVIALAWPLGRRLGWAELTAAALALTAAWIAALGFVLGRSTYQVTVDVARLRVTVGDKAFGGLTIANIGPRAVLASDFVLPVGRGRASFRAPRLAPGQDHQESFQIPTQRRAVVPLGPVRSSRGDPVGLLRRDLVWSQQLELFVHPATVSLEGSSAGFLKDLEGRPTDTLSSSDVAFHALRDYVMGDDLRHVHWKTSARLGKLMVRQFEETRRSHLVVCLAMDESEWPSPEAFELGVSLAASLGRQALHEDKDLTIRAPGRTLQTGTEQRLLDDFSRLDFGGPQESLEMVAQAAAADAPDASVAVLVAGSNLSGARFHAAARRFPVDVATVLVRVEPGLALGRGAIASSAVLTVGALGDFPRAFRSLGA